jgi:hypothetical protein
MSLDNRNIVVSKHNVRPVVTKYPSEILKLEFDCTEWTELDTTPSTVGARTFTPLAGSSGSAPTLSVPAVSGQKITATLSAGTAGYKATVDFLATMADGQIKQVLFDVYVVADPDPALAVLREQDFLVDGRYNLVGNGGGALISSCVKKAGETYKVTFDFTDWNKDSGTTVSSAAAATFNPAVNNPAFGSVSASGQKVTGTLSGGTSAFASGGYGLMAIDVTMANTEVKRIFLAIKID